jgi:hypothetical protein
MVVDFLHTPLTYVLVDTESEQTNRCDQCVELTEYHLVDPHYGDQIWVDRCWCGSIWVKKIWIKDKKDEEIC